jgi:hypothetical protein
MQGFDWPHPTPPDSYSREIDHRVCMQEMPYGYTSPPPPADTGDFDQARLESHMEYPKSHGRAV